MEYGSSFDFGWDAFNDGKNLTDNPHEQNSKPYNIWKKGWEVGKNVKDNENLMKQYNIRSGGHPGVSVTYYEGRREDIWNFFKHGQGNKYSSPNLYAVSKHELEVIGLNFDHTNTYKMSVIDVI